MKYIFITGTINLNASWEKNGITDEGDLAQIIVDTLMEHLPKECGVDEIEIDFEKAAIKRTIPLSILVKEPEIDTTNEIHDITYTWQNTTEDGN